MKRIGTEGFACEGCGKELRSDDFVEVCSDCGAIFCKNCVEEGEFKNHKCEDLEYGDY